MPANDVTCSAVTSCGGKLRAPGALLDTSLKWV